MDEMKKKDKKPGKIKKSFTSRQFKLGAYQSLITVVVIAVVVVINLMVTKMDIMIDLSSDAKYTLTEDTKNMLKSMEDKVTLYYMVQEGNETDMIEKVVNQYANQKGNVKVEKKDPVNYPTFAKQYTEDSINDNDLIVVNEVSGKAEHVAASDMIPVSFDQQTMQQSYDTLDAEGQITSAIQSVTSKETQKLYFLKTRNTQELAASFKEMLTKCNVKVEELSLDNGKKVPEDCNFLVINGPEYDISDTEYLMIKDYLEKGGKGMFFLNSQAKDSNLTNFYKLMQDYGVQVEPGFVVEDQDNSLGQLTIAKPKVEVHDITEGVSQDKNMALVPITKGLKAVENVRSTLKLEPLFTSSENAFSRVDQNENSLSKIDSDVAGPFTFAYAITDEFKSYKTRLLVFGSFEFANESFIESEQYGNRITLLNAINWLSDQETKALSIPKRSLTETRVEVPASDRLFLSILLVGVLPLGLLTCGVIIWYRRRKS